MDAEYQMVGDEAMRILKRYRREPEVEIKRERSESMSPPARTRMAALESRITMLEARMLDLITAIDLGQTIRGGPETSRRRGRPRGRSSTRRGRRTRVTRAGNNSGPA